MLAGKHYLMLGIYVFLVLSLSLPDAAYSMHIMEGFLPRQWCLFWLLVTLPFFIFGLRSIKRTVTLDPKLKMLLAFAGAFAFALSALHNLISIMEHGGN